MHRETEYLGFSCSKQSWTIQQSKVRHVTSILDITVFMKSLSLHTKELVIAQILQRSLLVSNDSNLSLENM